MINFRKFILAAMFLCLTGTSSFAGEVRTKVREIEAGKSVVDLYARPDARQRVLVLAPKKPTAAVILFAGGTGKIRIKKNGVIKRDGNFLVRSRERFSGHGFVTAVFDVPSDQDTLRDNRTEDWHVKDVAAVVSYLKKTFKLPVWLVGTSRGTMTVGYVGEKLTKQIDGIAFTASMDEVAHLDTGKITVPAFVLHHKNDDCHVTTPDGAKDIAKSLIKSPKVELVYLAGGISPGEDCGGQAHHGFNGIEDEAVGKIAKFIRENTNK